jgi:hypothetical protein
MQHLTKWKVELRTLLMISCKDKTSGKSNKEVKVCYPCIVFVKFLFESIQFVFHQLPIRFDRSRKKIKSG